MEPMSRRGAEMTLIVPASLSSNVLEMGRCASAQKKQSPDEI
jgi:hypothetical protein